MKEIEVLAGQVVDKQSRREIARADREISAIQHGKGCSCRNCVTGAVRTYNFWSLIRYGSRAAWEAAMVEKDGKPDIVLQPRDKNPSHYI